MITIEDQFVIQKPVNEVWAFFDDFEGLATCVPTLKEFKLVEGNRIEGKVGVTLGAIPVTSKIRLDITSKRAPECIQAHGISYLGETISTQLAKDATKYQANDTGELFLHLDLRAESSTSTRVMLSAGVEAEGKLRKMYETIMKLKVPAMKQEFMDKVGKAMNTTCVRPEGGSEMCVSLDAVKVAIEAHNHGQEAAPVNITATLSLWNRMVAWFKNLFPREAV